MKTHLRHRIVAGLAVGALALAACGDDDGGGDSVQDEVADLLIDDFNEGGEEVEGMELDEGCVRDVSGQLSDEDAQAILDAGANAAPDVSSDADELLAELIGCIDIDLSEIELDE